MIHDTPLSPIAHAKYADEAEVLARLKAVSGLDATARRRICDRAAGLVREIRGSARPGLMEVFLAE